MRNQVGSLHVDAINRVRLMSIMAFLIALFGVSVMTVSAQAESNACGRTIYEVGESRHTIEWEGEERAYLLYVPSGYDPTLPTPLVLSLHGFASNPAQQQGYSIWNEVAESENFIVVYPAGSGFPLRWNSGLFTEAAAQSADDVAFLSYLIDQLSTPFCIDQTRIYMNGLSNGGGMSYRFACEMADRVAAIGGVSGAYNLAPSGCEPSQPVPVILFHGTDDPIVPYAGGASSDPNSTTEFPSVPQYAAAWAERDGCSLEPEPISDLPDSIDAIRYTGCDNGVEVAFYTILGGGHTWAGSGASIPEFFAGVTNRDIEASMIMWEFFQRFTRE